MRYQILSIFLLSGVTRISAQGCSDAGFCSLGALKNIPQQQVHKNSIDIGATMGVGQQQTFTINPYIQYEHRLNGKLSVAGKVTATYARGFLGTEFAPGDFYGVLTYTAISTKPATIRLIGGFKIPFTVSNTKSHSGKPLPLDYQSSIGTYDLIAGINYIIEQHLELNAAVQLPVIQVNRNTFFPDEYADVRANDFAPTNIFRRKADVLLRAGYYIPVGSSVVIKPNVLGIYHLGKDSYENRFGARTAITNSAGLTLNAGLVITKHFSNATQLELIAATPFVVRDARPDGLTRAFAFSIQYSISF